MSVAHDLQINVLLSAEESACIILLYLLCVNMYYSL